MTHCGVNKEEAARHTFIFENGVPRRLSLPRRKTVIPTKEGSDGFGDLTIWRFGDLTIGRFGDWTI
jgi:hypothetical protein